MKCESEENYQIKLLLGVKLICARNLVFSWVQIYKWLIYISERLSKGRLFFRIIDMNLTLRYMCIEVSTCYCILDPFFMSFWNCFSGSIDDQTLEHGALHKFYCQKSLEHTCFWSWFSLHSYPCFLRNKCVRVWSIYISTYALDDYYCVCLFDYRVSYNHPCFWTEWHTFDRNHLFKLLLSILPIRHLHVPIPHFTSKMLHIKIRIICPEPTKVLLDAEIHWGPITDVIIWAVFLIFFIEKINQITIKLWYRIHSN